jgi:hypothetical protein
MRNGKKEMADTTAFSIKTEILADLWMDYRDEKEFASFIEYNDLGLPLAYAITNGIVEATPMAEQFLNESFRLLLASLGIAEDTGFDSLDDVLTLAEPKPE